MTVVCIGRGTQAGGRALAERVAERLGCPVLGREVLQEAAVGLGVSAELVEGAMAGRPRFWTKFRSLRRAYVVAVQAALAEHVAAGDLVYHGLAGGILLRDLPGILRVRVVAPLDRRVRAVMRDSGLGPLAAEEFIRHADDTRACWVRGVYGLELGSPDLDDVVLNLDTLSLDAACGLVALLARRDEFAVTAAVRDRLADFRLACRVRLSLASDPALRPLDLEVAADRGAVIVSGPAEHLQDPGIAAGIRDRAGSVAGVTGVRLEAPAADPVP